MKKWMKRCLALLITISMMLVPMASYAAEEDEESFDESAENSENITAFATDIETETVTTREYTIRTRIGEEFEINTVDAENIAVSSDSIESTMAKSGISGGYDEDGNWVSSPVYAGWYYVAHQAGTYMITVDYKDGSQDIYTVYVTYALTEEDENLLEKLKTEWPAGVSAQREEIVKMALSGIGNITYNSGNATCSYKDPDADCLHCSQFVAWVYYQNGYDYSWVKAAEVHNRADVVNVEHDEMLPGDIGSYANEDGTGHTGIYLGTIDGVDYWCHSSTASGIDGVRAGTYTKFTYYSVYQPLAVFDDTTEAEAEKDMEDMKIEDELSVSDSGNDTSDVAETTGDDKGEEFETSDDVAITVESDMINSVGSSSFDSINSVGSSSTGINKGSTSADSANLNTISSSESQAGSSVSSGSSGSETSETVDEETDSSEESETSTATDLNLTSSTTSSNDGSSGDNTVVETVSSEETGKEDTTEYGKEDTTPASSESSSSNVSSSGSTKTGDESNMMVWLVLGILALSGCTASVIAVRRKRH